MHQWKLIKNTPQKAKELDHIKHLVRVQPVIFPDGLPLNDEDMVNFRLLPNGNFVRRGRSPFRPGKPLNLSHLEIIEHSCVNEDNRHSVRLSARCVSIVINFCNTQVL